MQIFHKFDDLVWTPFAIIISFDNENETIAFYKAMQEEQCSKQMKTIGSYIETCFEEQRLQRGQTI